MRTRSISFSVGDAPYCAVCGQHVEGPATAALELIENKGLAIHLEDSHLGEPGDGELFPICRVCEPEWEGYVVRDVDQASLTPQA